MDCNVMLSTTFMGLSNNLQNTNTKYMIWVGLCDQVGNANQVYGSNILNQGQPRWKVWELHCNENGWLNVHQWFTMASQWQHGLRKSSHYIRFNMTKDKIKGFWKGRCHLLYSKGWKDQRW